LPVFCLQDKRRAEFKNQSWFSGAVETAKVVVPLAVAGYFAYKYAKEKKWI